MANNDIYITWHDQKRLGDLLEQAFNNNRENKKLLEELKNELQKARIVEPKEIPSDVVTMNSQVSLKDLESGEIMEYKLVFPEKANIDEKRISILAPVGTAIIGCKEGDIIEWRVPGGIRKLKIEKVIYQPEAAGNYDL